MIMQDKLEKERNDAKNYVEEYVYDMRDKLHGMLEKFVGESVSRCPPPCRLQDGRWDPCLENSAKMIALTNRAIVFVL